MCSLFKTCTVFSSIVGVTCVAGSGQLPFGIGKLLFRTGEVGCCSGVFFSYVPLDAWSWTNFIRFLTAEWYSRAFLFAMLFAIVVAHTIRLLCSSIRLPIWWLSSTNCSMILLKGMFNYLHFFNHWMVWASMMWLFTAMLPCNTLLFQIKSINLFFVSSELFRSLSVTGNCRRAAKQSNEPLSLSLST